MHRNEEKKSQSAAEDSKSVSKTATMIAPQAAKAEHKPVMAEIKTAAEGAVVKAAAAGSEKISTTAKPTDTKSVTADAASTPAAAVTVTPPAPAKSQGTLSESAGHACCGGSAKSPAASTCGTNSSATPTSGASPAPTASSAKTPAAPAAAVVPASAVKAPAPTSQEVARPIFSLANEKPSQPAAPIANASPVPHASAPSQPSSLATASSVAQSSHVDRAAVAEMISKLRNGDADVAREAAVALGATGSPAAVDALIAVLDNANGYFHSVVRSAAASSLAQLKDLKAIDALKRAVRDPMAEASAEAVRALAKLGDARSADALIGVLRNTDGYFLPVVRLAAVQALRGFGTSDARKALADVAANAGEDAVIRHAAGR